MYADDKQLYASALPRNTDAIRGQLENCIDDVYDSCASRRLQINKEKTELIWFGTGCNLQKLSSSDITLTVGDSTIQPTECVRDLGVLLDSELNLQRHIAKVTSVGFYHLRRLKQLRTVLGENITKQLVCSLILSRIDYCNTVLAGLPANTIAPLQRLQNAAARIVFRLGPHDHISTSLQQLHWLPVSFRIKYKLCLLMHLIHTNQSPLYLSELVTPVSNRSGRTSLRSSSTAAHLIPRTKLKFGERAFAVAGPVTWNSLPDYLHRLSDTPAFKRQLKTFFYCQAF